MGLVTVALPVAALAFTTPTHSDRANALETASGVATKLQPSTQWTAPQGAEARWQSFLESEGGRWKALWDADTGVPKRILGEGIAAPGASLNAELAADAARAVITRHLALLAPGVEPSDLEQVSNHYDGRADLRTVAFVQRHRGLEVLGGQVSVRIKNDRIFVLASEAWPNVDAAPVAKPVREDAAVAAALEWMAGEAEGLGVRQGPKQPFVLPIRSDEAGIEYRTVVEVVIDARAPVGRWSVYLDAKDGAPVARRQTLMFASGTVLVNAPERRPTSTRLDYPADRITASANGVSGETTGTGELTWEGDAPANIRLVPTGPRVRVDNAAGPRASIDATLEPGGTFVWDARDDELVDAQLNTFVHGAVAKDYALTISPNNRWVAQGTLQATVNINDQCNAFSDGNTINFFRSSRRCENTGRLADVVHHEFGHSYHANSIIRGAGRFDTALSEGASDYLAATISDDNGMGRGFFYSNAPLRDVDEARDRRWPEDANDEPHQVGLIFGGAMWDLRKNLLNGGTFATDQDAVHYTDVLWYAALQRSSDIPSSYAEVLAADDDDGNLSNGTPNVCAINEAFGRHGLADEEVSGPPIQNPVVVDNKITIPLGETPNECPGAGVTSMTLVWQLRDAPASQGQVTLAANNGGFEGAIPEQPPGSVVQYRVEVNLDDGNRLLLPDNPADPYYELFVGDVVPLYCTDFETDPELDNWEHALLAGENREGADDWTWAEPQSPRGSGDPTSAFSGRYVIGNDLGGGNYNGQYQADKENVMYAPTIDTQRYPVVRLQYRRWLTVEDGDFDQGVITSNGVEVWKNYATGGRGDTHHVDKEWRFHDVDLTETVRDDRVQVSFLLRSDRGLEFGGWTIDDFCIVGFLPPGANICGNGVLEGSEVCDDGNLADDDGCQADCTFTPGMPACGDGNVDPGEMCDDGNIADGDGCESTCVPTPADTPDCESDPSLCETPEPGLENLGEGDGGCGCTANEAQDSLPSGLALFALGALFFARRRRR